MRLGFGRVRELRLIHRSRVCKSSFLRLGVGDDLSDGVDSAVVDWQVMTDKVKTRKENSLADGWMLPA